MDSIDKAWSDLSQAVKSVPSSASGGDAQESISESAQELQSAMQTSLNSYDCSGSSS